MSPERIMDTINPFGPYRREYDTAFVDVTLLEEISNVYLSLRVKCYFAEICLKYF